jgi:DNA-binding transcriptional MerR regulator
MTDDAIVMLQRRLAHHYNTQDRLNDTGITLGELRAILAAYDELKADAEASEEQAKTNIRYWQEEVEQSTYHKVRANEQAKEIERLKEGLGNALDFAEYRAMRTLCDKQATEIERLRAALVGLIKSHGYTTYPPSHPIWQAFEVARQALEGSEP